MEKKEIIAKIMKKKELSQLPLRDVKLALSKFDKEASEEEKIRRTRELLHRVYGGFTSQKLLKPRNKDEEWILRKHLSTRERLPYYTKVYGKIFEDLSEASVIDLGAGVNGLSYLHFPLKVNYAGIEAVGQLVEIANFYFKKNKIKGKMHHLSLFDLKRIKEIIRKVKRPRIVLAFKVIDCLEMLKRDYSKELLEEIVPLVDLVVISFATRSMGKRERFRVNRKWILDFVKKRFKLLDDFEVGGERYIVLKK